MSEPLSFSSFVSITQDIANDAVDGFLPTFADPIACDLKVLKGVPADVDIAEAARSWALGQGQPRFYIAYAGDAGVIAEAYENGALTESTSIQLTN